MAIDDSDETRQPSSSTPSDHGEHVRVDRDPLVELAEREQVVDADGLRALEAVVGRRDPVEALEPDEIVGQRIPQLGLDDALEDRVPVAGDALCVRRQRVGSSTPLRYRHARLCAGRVGSPTSRRRLSCIPKRP